MDRGLANFIRAARAAGVEISTSESIDAARALVVLGYADKAALKSAFSVVLAKTMAEKAICDRVFDQFFSLPEAAASEEPFDAADETSEPRSDDTGRPPSDPNIDRLMALSRGSGRGAGGGGDRLMSSIVRAAQGASVDDIRFSSQVSYYVRQTMDGMGIAPLEARLRDLLLYPSRNTQQEAADLAEARDRLQREVRAYVAGRFELFGRPATETFLADVAVNRQIGRMGSLELERMKVAVARMAKRLATKHSRRRRVATKGKLDLRRTLRANAGNDGVPFDLFFKFKKRDKPSIVAICDVSSSVSQQVRFLLLFLHALRGEVADLRTFAFSNHLYDIGAPLDTLPFDDAMDFILEQHGTGSTDYGQAFADLEALDPDLIDRRTTVIVLGDGRANQNDPRLDLFREMSERAKRMIWLCPEAPGRWGTGDSCMLLYRTWATHVSHCTTAKDIDRAIDEALQAYA